MQRQELRLGEQPRAGTQAVDDAGVGVETGSAIVEVPLQLGQGGQQARQRPAQDVRELVAGNGYGGFGDCRFQHSHITGRC